MDHSKCKDLFDASTALFEESGLIRWHGGRFTPRYPGQDDSHFEDNLKDRFSHNYGRYMGWVLFSVASENLIKAAFACMSISYAFSDYPLDKTLDALLRNRKKQSDNQLPSLLMEMCQYASLDAVETKVVETGYLNLKRIRNRDVHGYERDKRRYNFKAVESEFVPAFSVLLSIMKIGGHFPSCPGDSTGS